MTERPARSRTDLGFAGLSYLLAVLFVAAGGMKLVPVEFERAGFAHFGYAPWFMVLIGFVEIAGGLLLFVRQIRPVGALLMAATMVGAVASHLRAGDGFGMATPAFLLLILLVVVALRSGTGLPARSPARLAASRSA